MAALEKYDFSELSDVIYSDGTEPHNTVLFSIHRYLIACWGVKLTKRLG
jgi:hypothetical protein